MLTVDRSFMIKNDSYITQDILMMLNKTTGEQKLFEEDVESTIVLAYKLGNNTNQTKDEMETVISELREINKALYKTYQVSISILAFLFLSILIMLCVSDN